LERDRTEIAVLLCEAIGDEVPDKVKLEQLSKAMYKEDKEEAKKEFSKILASLSPDVVSSTAVNDYGSVLRDAVLEGKTDFIRLLLEHGVDPTVGTDNVKDTPVQLVNSVELKTLFAEYGFAVQGDEKEELPDDLKDQQSKVVEAMLEFIELIGSLTPGFSPLVLLACFIALCIGICIGIGIGVGIGYESN